MDAGQFLPYIMPEADKQALMVAFCSTCSADLEDLVLGCSVVPVASCSICSDLLVSTGLLPCLNESK